MTSLRCGVGLLALCAAVVAHAGEPVGPSARATRVREGSCASPDPCGGAASSGRYRSRTHGRTGPQHEIAPYGAISSVPASPMGATTSLSQAADALPATSIARTGPLGAPAFLSVRGSDRAHVAIVVDGVPLTSAFGPVLDIDLVPPSLVRTISLYRGAVPVQLGASSVGGLLSLELREPRDRSRLEAEAVGGSFGFVRGTLALEGPVARGAGVTAATFERADNRFSFFDDGGTPLNLDDDGTVMRANADTMRGAWLVRFAGRLRGWDVAAFSLPLFAARGVPGSGLPQAREARWAEWRLITGVSAERDVARGDVEVVSSAVLEGSRFRDPGAELGPEPDDARAHGISLMTGARPTFALAPGLQLHGVMDARVESLQGEAASDATRLTFAPGAELAWGETAGRAEAAAGGRADLARDEGPAGTWWAAAPSAFAGGVFRPWASENASASVFASLGIAARPPAFFELYGDRGALRGNAELEPESRRGIEGGAQVRLDHRDVGVELTYSAFLRDVRDLIVFIQLSGGYATPANVARARIAGHELALTSRLTRWIRIDGDVTLLDARDRTPGRGGNALPQRPRTFGAAAVALLFGGPELSARLLGAGPAYLDGEELRPTAARVSLDLEAAYRPRRHWAPTLAVTLANATGARVQSVARTDGGAQVRVPYAVSDLWGQPLPGRALYVALRHAWTPALSPQLQP